MALIYVIHFKHLFSLDKKVFILLPLVGSNKAITKAVNFQVVIKKKTVKPPAKRDSNTGVFLLILRNF